MRKLLTYFFVFANSATVGCSSSLLSVYRIDVQQGNAVTEEALAKLQLGMSPDQIRFILGNPLIRDPFHGGRWDYVYFFKPGAGAPEQRQVTLRFDDGKVVHIGRGSPLAPPAGSARNPLPEAD